MNKQYYIGLDVHKETIAIAYTHAHSRNKPTFYKTCSGSNLSCERNLRKINVLVLATLTEGEP